MLYIKNLYFKLLTEFPEYRQKEFDEKNGAYSDMYSNAWQYPTESEKRLRLHQYANAD